MTRAQVHVDLPDGRTVLAGQIEGLDAAPGTLVRTLFTYDDSYLADRGHYPISPELPLVSGPQSTASDRTLFGAVADAGPDGWGRRLVHVTEAEAARVEGRTRRTLDDLDVVLAVQDATRQGALRFRMPGADHFAGPAVGDVPAIVEIPSLLAAIARVEAGEPLDAPMRRLLAAGTTMGGARPKATVRRDAADLAVAKFPQDNDRWNVEAWEWATWVLAGRAGLDVAPARLVHIDPDRSIFVQRRFDRGPSGQRIGYQSAATLLERPARALVTTRPATYVELAEALQDVSERPRHDGHQLLRRVAFTILVSNTDDHLWNHGLLRSTGGWRLAPAFDVNPHPWPTGGSTPLSSHDAGERTVEQLIESADAYDATRDEARAVVREVEEATGTWRDAARLARIEEDAMGAMSAAFDGPARRAARRMAP